MSWQDLVPLSLLTLLAFGQGRTKRCNVVSADDPCPNLTRFSHFIVRCPAAAYPLAVC